MAPLLHGRRSVCWDHFVKRDVQNKLAECMHCNDILCYTSTSANLLKHLERRHNCHLKNDNNEKEDKSAINVKLLESEYWEYFILDEDEKTATCKLCSEEVDYETSSTAPLDHLKEKHSSDVLVTEDDDRTDYESGDDIDATVEIYGRKRRNPSIAWDYFDIDDKDKKLARCKICGDVKSYRTSVTNLIRHVTRKHHIAVGSTDRDNTDTDVKKERETVAEEAVTDGDVVDDSEQPERKRRLRSPIWLYFRPVDLKNKRSECRICKKVLSYATTVSNLKMHLARKHPNMDFNPSGPGAGTKSILMTAGGDLYEVESENNGDLVDDDDDHHQNEVEEMDTVYLEDFDNLENPSKTQKPKSRRKEKAHLPTIDLHDSSSDDDVPITSLQRKKSSDALDHFGRYVASLLRELPKEISNRLQSDFVSKIMDAQLTYEAQKRQAVKTQESAYSITVTAVDSQSDVEQNVAAEVVVSQSLPEL